MPQLTTRLRTIGEGRFVHRRVLATLMALAIVPALVWLGLAPATAANATSATPEVGTLVSVSAARQKGFDRIVWQFDGPLPKTRLVDWVKQLNNGASDENLPVAGNAILRLTMYNAQAHRLVKNKYIPTVPRRQSFGLTNVTEIVQNDDWEAVVGYGVGMDRKQSYKLFTMANPNRVVLDIRTDFPTTTGSVSFVNGPNYQKGRQPYVVAKARTLDKAFPAASALNHLFAGPTASEYAAGLRLINSKATGWSNLSIKNGVARVRLTGNCASGGSSMTIANQIMPTLKQFSGVKYVKIYDPAGRTLRPTGNSNSLPACLQP